MTPVTTPRDAGLCFHTAGHRQPPGLPGWWARLTLEFSSPGAGSPPHCQKYRPGTEEGERERGRRYQN